MIIMLALCLMLLATYYAQNYVRMLAWSLTVPWPILSYQKVAMPSLVC